MRILHIGKFYPPFHGGMESFLAALVESQTKMGHQVAVLVHAHAPDGIATRPALVSPFPWIVRVPCFGRLLYAPVSPAFPFWLIRTITDFKPDVLHLHLPNTSAFWALGIPSARRLPWVIHWHADVVESAIDQRLKLAYRFYRPFEQSLLRRAAAVIVTSPPYLESSPALRPWRDKCHVVPLGLPPVVDDPEGRLLSTGDWQPGFLRILAIGRLTYYKGFETLIHAMKKVPQAQAIIVGEGELRQRLESLLAESGLGDRVRLAGSLPVFRLNSLQDTCDVFCLPSVERTEAFGVVLLEAMQRAKPVVASDIPGSGVGWVVVDGMTGELVPPGDSGALANRLQAMANEEKRAKLGQAGLDRFNGWFRIDRITQAIDQVYQAVG